MDCDLITAALNNLQCERTFDGLRVLSHCLYPNFEQVPVYVQTHMDGFLVHDGGEAYDLAFLEGRSPSALKAFMREYASLFGVDSDDHRIFGRALTHDWLPNVIMAVANASAAAANALVMSKSDLAKQDDNEFREHAFQILREAFTDKRVPRRVKRRGRTGKMYTFAFGVTLKEKMSLVDVVAPSSISVASRFTTFSAVTPRAFGGAFLAYNRDLASEDAALLSEVADVLPLDALVASVERSFDAATILQ
jgi:hypothetical protein